MKRLSLLGMVLLSSAAAHADVDLATCQSVVDQIDSITDTGLLNDCSDFYFDNGQDENPPDSYNNTIALIERSVDVDPYQAELYTDGAWLLWSKWDTWFHNPSLMPDGQDKAAEAVQLCQQGEQYYGTNSPYLLDVANTLQPLAQQYIQADWPVVMDADYQAEVYAPDAATHVRARLNMGHYYRFQSENANAIAWYQSVLPLDPQNAVALRYLQQLCGTSAQCTQPGPVPAYP